MADHTNANVERGRVTLTLRDRDKAIVAAPDGSPLVEVYLVRGEHGRARLSVEAPKTMDISRVPRE